MYEILWGTKIGFPIMFKYVWQCKHKRNKFVAEYQEVLQILIVCFFTFYPPWKAHTSSYIVIYVPHYITKDTIFIKSYWRENALCETLSILRRIRRDITTNVHTGPYVKHLLFLSEFGEIWIFLTKFLQTLKYKISWKSSSWETISKRKEGRTGRYDETKQ